MKNHLNGVTAQSTRQTRWFLGTPEERRQLEDIVDGTSNTIAVIECPDDLAVPWTKPDEGLSSEMFDIKLLLGMYPNGTNIAFADGSTHFIPNSVDPETLRNLMKMNDGNIVNPWDLKESIEEPSTMSYRCLKNIGPR